MGLAGFANIVEHALLYWLAGIAAIVLYRCFKGDINLAGMLAHDQQGASDGRPAPERVQLLFAFFIAVAAYARLTLVAAHSAGAPLMTRLPEAPNELIALFAASHGIYLTGKFGRAMNLGRFMTNRGT